MAVRKIGVHESGSPAATAARFPGASWGRVFISDKGAPLPVGMSSARLVALVSAAVRPWTAPGFGCVVSIKLDMGQVTKGAWDARLGDVATALAALNVILAVHHEPENDTKAAVFVAGNDRAYDVVKRAAPGLLWATVAMTYAWATNAKPAVRVSPADAKVWARARADIALADAYFGKTFPFGILPDHAGWARWYELVAPAEWGMAEFGWLNLPGRPEVIDRNTAWFADDPVGRTCQMVLVWGTTGTENNAGWLLGDTGSQQAVARMTARLSIPVGYRPSPVGGFVVSERSGALVAVDLTDTHDRLFTAAPRLS